jgi:hypothetical protein
MTSPPTSTSTSSATFSNSPSPTCNACGPKSAARPSTSGSPAVNWAASSTRRRPSPSTSSPRPSAVGSRAASTTWRPASPPRPSAPTPVGARPVWRSGKPTGRSCATSKCSTRPAARAPSSLPPSTTCRPSTPAPTISSRPCAAGKPNSSTVMPSGFTRLTAGLTEETAAWSWLCAHYHALSTHLAQFEKAARKRADQGEFWWELRSCDYYPAFDQPKIFWPDIAKLPRFSCDEDGAYVNDKGFIISVSAEENWLLPLLQNRVQWFCISQLCTPPAIARWPMAVTVQETVHRTPAHPRHA